MINQWSEAYPEDIFAKPDWGEVHKQLKEANISGGAVAADCMRYVVTKMKESMEKISE